MTTIYLSSTYEDLMEHRRVVIDTLRKSSYQVIAMEDYVATDRRPVEECLRDIDEKAQIYVGIFAFRYGYIPAVEQVRDCKYTKDHDDWQGLSITELEFRYSKREASPALLHFLVKEGTPWNTAHIDALMKGDEEHPGYRINKIA